MTAAHKLHALPVFLITWCAAGLAVQGPRKDGHSHAIVMPKEKLALCYFQKVASEHFCPMFNRVNQVNVTSAWCSKPSQLGVKWSSVTKEQGWKFAIFVRDPLERYLSAFLSKCVPTALNMEPANEGKFCHGPTRSQPVTIEEEITLFEERVRSDAANGLANDGHWESQATTLANRCGMKRFRPSQLDFLGYLTHDLQAVNHEVQSMLSLTKLNGVAKLANEYFPLPKVLAKGVSQCPKQHCTMAHEKFSKFYRSNETVRIVQSLLQNDYDTFQFKKLIP